MNTQYKPSTTSKLNVSEKSYISIQNQLEYMIKDQSYLWSLRDQKNIKSTDFEKNNIFLARFTEVKSRSGKEKWFIAICNLMLKSMYMQFWDLYLIEPR